MARGKRKRKAPSQCGAHSADELNNASHEEDMVLLSQPCSSVTSVSSPAGKYIPKFSSKKSKLSKSKEELLEAPPKRIPSFSCEKAVVGEALPSEADGGLEDTVADQLTQQQASGEDKEPKRSTIGERTLVVVLKKSCANKPDTGGSNSFTSPTATAPLLRRGETASETATAPNALEDNVTTSDPVGNEIKTESTPGDSVPPTERQLEPVARDTAQVHSTTTQDAEAQQSEEANIETKAAKLNQFCDLLGGDSDEEEINLQPFFSQQFGKTKEPLHELPLSQPAGLGRPFCAPGLALSQAIPVPMVGTTPICTAVEEEKEGGNASLDENDECCLQHVPTSQTCRGRESTDCEPLEGSSAHDDQFMDQMETADTGSSLPLNHPVVGGDAAVPCSEDGGLDKDGPQIGMVPGPLGDQEGLSLYQGVGEGEGKQEAGGEGGPHAEEAADPLLDSLMEEDCVYIDVCQLERQLQVEFPPEPLQGSTSTPTSKGAPKILNVDTEEMHLEVSSGDSSASGGKEREVAGFDDSGVKLLQGILTELSSLNCFVMACRRELETSRRQRRQWLRATRQQQQRK